MNNFCRQKYCFFCIYANYSVPLQHKNIFTMKKLLSYLCAQSTYRLLTFSLLAYFLISCTPITPFSLHWEFGSNDVEPGICEAYLTLTNTSDQELTHEGWTLYFNLMSLHPIYTEGDALRETEIQASWHSIEPTQTFTPLAPGESRTFTMRYKGSAIRENICPEGFFLVTTKHSTLNPKPITIPCTYAPYTRPEQMKRGIVTWEKTPYADGEYVFDYVENILGNRTASPTGRLFEATGRADGAIGERRKAKGERREVQPLLP
jgi:hypothetical protein